MVEFFTQPVVMGPVAAAVIAGACSLLLRRRLGEVLEVLRSLRDRLK